MRRLRIFLLLCVLAVAAPALAQDDTTVTVVSYGFIEGDQAVEIAKTMLSPKGKVTANTRNNTLIVVDTPESAQFIAAYFRDLPPPRNVFIEVSVSEYGPSTQEFAGLPFRGAASAQNRLIQLTVLDGGHGSIMVGDRVPYQQFFHQYFLSHGYILEGVVFEEVGTKLDVHPKIYGNQAEITLTPSVSYYSGGRRETIAVRELSTQVTVANGQSIEIGSTPSAGEFSTYFYRNQFGRSVRFVLKPRW